MAELAARRQKRPWREVLIVGAARLTLPAAPAGAASVIEAPVVSGDPTPGSLSEVSGAGVAPGPVDPAEMKVPCP